MKIVIPVPVPGHDLVPSRGQVFLLPDHSFICGCGNIAETGAFHPCTETGELLANETYTNGEENPDWRGYYWCGGCGEIVIDARELTFPTS